MTEKSLEKLIELMRASTSNLDWNLDIIKQMAEVQSEVFDQLTRDHFMVNGPSFVEHHNIAVDITNITSGTVGVLAQDIDFSSNTQWSPNVHMSEPLTDEIECPRIIDEPITSRFEILDIR